MRYKLGKKHAIADKRVPRMSVSLPKLPAPPDNANWYAMIPSWPMLGNDNVGDCVEAAVLHCIQQFSAYAGRPLTASETEALSFYEVATGYNPADPNTDQGSYVLGSGGVMQFWLDHGVTCGGTLDKVQLFLQITHKNPTEWMQGISLFGGMLTGLQLPQVIVAGDTIPYVWSEFSGPVAGGHEVWINGYETLPSGRVYDLVSWGQMYRATEAFLQNCLDEAVVVVDEDEFNARGVNAGNLSLAQLTSDMAALRG